MTLGRGRRPNNSDSLDRFTVNRRPDSSDESLHALPNRYKRLLALTRYVPQGRLEEFKSAVTLAQGKNCPISP